ncbi:hypothetical protein GCK72_024947 [Caenorhabditis remanei]|uniref:Uncharacterized protein n=1 Tax=Caenorhabditis remanei TaxID=31234 RepID=A0A6A5G0L5_CAERE|nr:hypothetical protein GCK72_024947 [Caenorhabditis remanei]KAF1748480.1 hypothetical protein GCK72_024947 [Caenorhabditis remanei]
MEYEDLMTRNKKKRPGKKRNNYVGLEHRARLEKMATSGKMKASDSIVSCINLSPYNGVDCPDVKGVIGVHADFGVTLSPVKNCWSGLKFAPKKIEVSCPGVLNGVGKFGDAGISL